MILTWDPRIFDKYNHIVKIGPARNNKYDEPETDSDSDSDDIHLKQILHLKQVIMNVYTQDWLPLWYSIGQYTDTVSMLPIRRLVQMGIMHFHFLYPKTAVGW